MRTGTIKIDGEKHVLCFSLRVVRSCVERYGSASGLYDALAEKDELKALNESMWVLSEMMAAGDRYAKSHGIENSEPLTFDDLYDLCDISDFANLRASIIATVNNGRKTVVEVESSPNAEATQGKN